MNAQSSTCLQEEIPCKAQRAPSLVRFFQIENKLDSVVRADISRQIPLAP